MLRKIYNRSILSITRFLLHLLLNRKHSNSKKTGFEEVNDIMQKFQTNLITNQQLTVDLTEGPVPGRNKNSRRLITAFESNRDKREEENFYVKVARDWVSDLTRKRHRTALACIIIFLGLYLSGLFLNQYISGWSGAVILCGMFVCPILGFFSAALGRGWKKWVLLSVNLLLLSVFIMIIV
ncbi:hypothetical protein MUO14_16840 [Halobacillus shinanisalinarum]|uniref:Uncharacterized protein n=1 Tax=Halobacillus shinanisalinarum TaxID=2932258 RepID=A0ABY4GXK3_9BACI|nr:hypothetical protein [Halobacillus shinanisalinarum]UOQ92147.1 hypothetical protein MUO14_16840 [Halobacillus shinanisalinarum]